MTTMRISQLAERCGVPATTLRFYERKGLVTAERSPTGYRRYGEDSVRRLAFINAAKHLGLPLQEIGALLAVWEAGACAEVKADLRPRIVARLAEAECRVVELEAFADSLRTALENLDALPDRAVRCDADCDLLVSESPQSFDAERWRTAPVACSLSAQGESERVAAWRAAVGGATVTQIPDGVRLTLPVGRTAAVAALAVDEQECCPFFDFRLHLDGEVVHLEVRAPAAGGGMLAGLFGVAL